MRESQLQDQIRLACGLTPGVALWRNNVGMAHHCDRWRDCAEGIRCHHCGEVVLQRGHLQRVAYGLAVGSADLVGLVDGRFVALEVKVARGRTTSEQERWLELVRGLGGVAAVVRSPEDALAVLEHARRQVW